MIYLLCALITWALSVWLLVGYFNSESGTLKSFLYQITSVVAVLLAYYFTDHFFARRFRTDHMPALMISMTVIILVFVVHAIVYRAKWRSQQSQSSPVGE